MAFHWLNPPVNHLLMNIPFMLDHWMTDIHRPVLLFNRWPIPYLFSVPKKTQLSLFYLLSFRFLGKKPNRIKGIKVDLRSFQLKLGYIFEPEKTYAPTI